MHCKSAVAIVATVLAFSSFESAAQTKRDAGFYIGGAVGQARWKDACSGVSGPDITCEDTDMAWKILGGYRINRYFSAELGYVDLGKSPANFSGFTDDITAQAWELSAIASLPIATGLSIYGRLGIYRAYVEEKGSFDTVKNSNNDATYGVGVGYKFTRTLGIRGEWQRYADVGGGAILKTDIDFLSLAVLWMF